MCRQPEEMKRLRNLRLIGTDKCVLGQFASEIRKSEPPEPYKGKGIRYADEHVKRKVGKAFASGSNG